MTPRHAVARRPAPARRRILAAVTSLVAICGGVAAVATITAPAANATTTPGVIGRILIAYSVQHRPIYAYRMGEATSPVKGVIVGQMHGDEPAGVKVANAILHGPALHGVDLWVIPTINPDGNAAHTRQNAHKVDLNRNWPNIWLKLTGEFYSGPKPLSEPETVGMYAFLSRVKPQYLVSLHQPLDGVDTTDGGARNVAFRHRLSASLHLPEKPLTCNSVCHGSMTGWLTTHQSGSAITVEFGGKPTAAYLTSTAAHGILSSIGARTGWPSLASAAGDLDGDHHPDLVVTTASGTLREYRNSGNPAHPFGSSIQIGTSGWNGFDRLGLADFNGDGRDDIVGSTAAGQLYEYPNTGSPTKPFGPRLLIGTSGWQNLNQLVFGDVDHDGKADVLATNAQGQLLEYPNTGSAAHPLSSHRVVGSSGWRAFDRLALADVNGDGRGDVVATTASGLMYEYLNSGSATKPFSSGRLIGPSGWQGLNQLVFGDVDRNGADDVIARNSAGQLWLYPNTGSSTRPYVGRTLIGASGWNFYNRLL